MVKAIISDIQAVVLCGPGHRLTTLVDEEKMPKCMLPIANRPMLYYPLSWLHRSGIHDVIVVANTAGGPRIQNYLTRVYEGPRVELVLLEEYHGTLQALRAIKSHLRHDFLLLGCDLLTDYPLGRIIGRWRLTGDETYMMAMLARPLPLHFGQQPKESTEPKHRLSDESGALVGVDGREERILTWILRDDVEDSTLTIPMAILTRYPHLSLRADLNDVHLYLFRHSLLETLFEQADGGDDGIGGVENFYSIREELIPRLVRRQLGSVDHYRCALYVIDHRGYCTRANTLSSFAECGKQMVRLFAASTVGGITPSVASPVTNNIATNTAAAVTSATTTSAAITTTTTTATGGSSNISAAPSTVFRLISQAAEIGAKTQIGGDSMIGDHSKVGDRSSVKRSVVGSLVNIGNNVKISNTIILDQVTIEDNVKLEGCIVGWKAHIHERSYLKDCDVGPEYIVERETTVKGETLGGSREIYLDMEMSSSSH